jgi:hypothetical protein
MYTLEMGICLWCPVGHPGVLVAYDIDGAEHTD